MTWMKILLCLAAICVLARTGEVSECLERAGDNDNAVKACLANFLAGNLPTLRQRKNGGTEREDAAALENERSSLLSKRRFWNDELEPCVLKYCQKYRGKPVYSECIRRYCPSGIAAGPNIG